MGKRIFALSMDDGGEHDAAVIAMLHEVKGRGTFYLPACVLLESVYAVKTMDEIRKLYDGHEVGCHGMMHLRLSAFQGDALKREIIDSREQIEAFFGLREQVRCFAYPYGVVTGDAKRILSKSPMKYARCTKRGDAEAVARATDRLAMPTTAQFEGPNTLRAAADAMERELPVHVFGHSWEVHRFGWWVALSGLLSSARDRGYDLVDNFTFFEETFAG